MEKKSGVKKYFLFWLCVVMFVGILMVINVDLFFFEMFVVV